MVSFLRARRLWLGVSLIVLLGCGDDSAPPPPPVFDSGVDAATDTGDTPDVGADSGEEDADPADTGGEDSGSSGECSAETEAISLVRDSRRDTRRVALAGGSGGVLAVWMQQNSMSFPNIYSRFIAATGESADSLAITNGVAQARDPEAVYTGDGFLVAWRDNFTPESGPYRIVTRSLDGSGVPSSAAGRMTAAEPATVQQDTPALAMGPSGPVAGYVRDDTMLERNVMLARLDSDGTTASEPSNLIPAPFSRIALTSRGDEGVAIAYAVLEEAERRVYYQALDENGGTDGTPVRVEGGGDANGVVNLATSPDNLIGVVFDVDVGGGGTRREIHFRQVEGDTGAVRGGEQIITGSDKGRDPAIAPFAGGWAIAYRALGEASTQIAVSFTDIHGDVEETVMLGETTEEGGPVSIASTTEGDLVVAWPEQMADGGIEILAQRIRCGE